MFTALVECLNSSWVFESTTVGKLGPLTVQTVKDLKKKVARGSFESDLLDYYLSNMKIAGVEYGKW